MGTIVGLSVITGRLVGTLVVGDCVGSPGVTGCSVGRLVGEGEGGRDGFLEGSDVGWAVGF